MINDERQVIKVHLLGEFSIYSDRGILNESKMHSDMLTKLLTYVILNRGRENTIEELTSVLWPNDNSNNPSGALKNLMYRLRTLLKKVWKDDDEYVLTGRGYYKWNPGVEVEVDAEVFEQLCIDIKKEEDIENRISYGIMAAELYKERFLKEYANEKWVAALSVTYHSLYVNMVKQLFSDLEEEGKYVELKQIAEEASYLEPLDEEIHIYLFNALINLHQNKEAIIEYSKLENRLYDSLGIRPSRALQEMYDQMMVRHHEQESDIDTIKQDLKENEEKTGAFYCEYGTFKDLYQLESRRIERLGMPVYLALITMYPVDELERDSVDYLAVVNKGMIQLKDVVLKFLRYGDAVTRYSVNQYLVLLPGCQYEDAKIVLDRTVSNYYQIRKHANTNLKYNLEEMEVEV